MMFPQIFHNLHWLITAVDLSGRTPREVATLGLALNDAGVVLSLERSPQYRNGTLKVGLKRGSRYCFARSVNS